jgi:ankyrin repeat protein
LLIAHHACIHHINLAGTTLAMISSGPGVHSIEHFTMLAAHSASFDSIDAQGKTALHYAARFGTAPEVTVLLQNGASPVAADHAGRTPLHEAVRCDNYSVVRAILGGDPAEAERCARQADFAGWNALHWAVRGNGRARRDFRLMKALLCLLLESGADAEAPGRYQHGWTPAALRGKNFSSVELAQAMGGETWNIWKESWSDFGESQEDVYWDAEMS